MLYRLMAVGTSANGTLHTAEYIGYLGNIPRVGEAISLAKFAVTTGTAQVDAIVHHVYLENPPIDQSVADILISVHGDDILTLLDNGWKLWPIVDLSED